MSIPRIAPVFTFDVKGPADEVCKRLRTLMNQETGAYEGSVAGNHITLTIREGERHFWSPWLHIELTELDKMTHIRGRFTPHPNIWTGFAFCYFSLIVIAAFALIWGTSQWMLDQRPTALWVGLACAVLVVVLWCVAQFGQKLAHEQMHMIRDTVRGIMPSVQDQ